MRMFSLQRIKIHYFDYLRFYVSVENAIPMHVVNSLKNLVHVVLDTLFRQVMSSAFDGFIHVHVHQLKDQCKSSCWLITASTSGIKSNKQNNMNECLTKELREAWWYSDVAKDVSKLEFPSGYSPNKHFIKQLCWNTHLVDVIKMCFHALDCDVFVCFGWLSLEHFRKRSFSLLAD